MGRRPGGIPWNKRSVEDHVRQGTLRPHRHLAHEQATPLSTLWQPLDDDLEALGGPGRRFLAQLLTEFEATPIEGRLLLEAAFCVDALATWRVKAQTDVQAARTAMLLTKQLAALLGQLRVR